MPATLDQTYRYSALLNDRMSSNEKVRKLQLWIVLAPGDSVSTRRENGDHDTSSRRRARTVDKHNSLHRTAGTYTLFTEGGMKLLLVAITVARSMLYNSLPTRQTTFVTSLSEPRAHSADRCVPNSPLSSSTSTSTYVHSVQLKRRRRRVARRDRQLFRRNELVRTHKRDRQRLGRDASDHSGRTQHKKQWAHTIQSSP